jgi:hypothetical protein
VIHREEYKDREHREEEVADNCAWEHNFAVASDEEDSYEDHPVASIACAIAMSAVDFEFYDSVVIL